MPTYSQKLKDPRWQKKRLKILERDKWTCTNCGDKKTTLNVHHKKYIYGKQPWQYEDSELATLCEPCHKLTHAPKSEPVKRRCSDEYAKKAFAKLRAGLDWEPEEL